VLLVLVPWIVLGVLSVGVFFPAPAAVVSAALVSDSAGRSRRPPTAWDESVEERPDLQVATHMVREHSVTMARVSQVGTEGSLVSFASRLTGSAIT
jgi:hypothetical protein